MSTGRTDTTIPRDKSEPKGPKQSSGKVIHARMKMAPKVENLRETPNVHN